MGRTDEFNASLILMLDEAAKVAREQAEEACGHLRALLGEGADRGRIEGLVEALVEASSQRALVTMLHHLEFEGAALDGLHDEEAHEPMEHLLQTQEVDYRATMELIIVEEERRLKRLQRESEALMGQVESHGDPTVRARLERLEEEQRRSRERIAQLVGSRTR